MRRRLKFPYLNLAVDPSSKNVEQWQTGAKALFRQMLGEEMKVIASELAKNVSPRGVLTMPHA